MSRGESWVSDELEEILGELSAQQARGVLRIVQAELDGRSLSSLLDCDDQICTSTTYYGSGKRQGWRQKPAFKKALALARQNYRQWMLQHGVEDALAILTETAPHAARALRQQIVGDEAAVAGLVTALNDLAPEIRRSAAARLGLTGLPTVVQALRVALGKERDLLVRGALVDALGQIAGLRDSDRRAAAAGVLDRAATETADKTPLPVAPGGEQTVNVFLQKLTNDELDHLIANLEAAESGVAFGETPPPGGG